MVDSGFFAQCLLSGVATDWKGTSHTQKHIFIIWGSYQIGKVHHTHKHILKLTMHMSRDDQFIENHTSYRKRQIGLEVFLREL